VAVSISTVAIGDIQGRLPALGTITPLATVTVKAQITGQLQKIAFTEGQLVHAGDFLAQIDPRPYEAALNQAEGNLMRDQALLANAAAHQAPFTQYVATVEADRAVVEAAKVKLAYTRIVSPATGRVGLRQVDPGNYVTPGDVNGIVVITQLQPITAIFPVPKDNITQISRHLEAGATPQVLAFDRSNRAKLAEGKLLTLDEQIDITTGTIKLRALFDNKDGALFPNQFVNIQLVVDALHDQIVIPTAAVRRGAPNGVVGTFVYLVNTKASTVSVRSVTLGTTDGERVAVTAGLGVGDVVVTEGGDRLRDGTKVQCAP
jgi:multidrug efflux system membrane fusion protein